MTTTLPLKRLVDPSRPITYGIVQAGEDVAGGVPYIRPVDMVGHSGVDPSTLRTTSWEIAAAYSRSSLKPGDVVVSIGPSFGKTMTVPDELDGANLTQGTARVAISSEVDRHYVVWALQSQPILDFWKTSVGGATFRALNLGPLAETPIPLPHLDEQRAIADYLDQETAQIDALVAKQEEFKAKLAERRVALISTAVVRGLDPEVSVKPSGADWFEAVPSHWRVERLKNSILDTQTGIWGNDPAGDGTDVLCVRVADFDRPLLRVGYARTMRAVTPNDARSRLLQRGDLLLEKSGGTQLNPVGFVVMYEGAKGSAVTSNFITRLRLRADQDSRYWLYAHATSYSTRLTARSVKQTTGIQNLDQASYFNELFPYPPLKEQRAIAHYLDKETSRIDTLIAKAEEHIALAKERRSALITAAVTGQFDVRTARKAG